jgi:hypothetical protein
MRLGQNPRNGHYRISLSVGGLCECLRGTVVRAPVPGYGVWAEDDRSELDRANS